MLPSRCGRVNRWNDEYVKQFCKSKEVYHVSLVLLSGKSPNIKAEIRYTVLKYISSIYIYSYVLKVL